MFLRRRGTFLGSGGLTLAPANRPEEPLVIVVLFGSVNRGDIDVEAHRATSARMAEIVSSIPGFISFNSYTSETEDEMAVVRFDSLEALDAWRNHPEHLEAQEKDRSLWSERYWIQVSSTVREYQWTRGVGYHPDLRAKFAASSEIPSSQASAHVEAEADV